jgi:hypothetical protein
MDEAGAGQDLEMVGDGGLALAERFDEVTHADLAGAGRGQKAQYL